MDTSESPMEVDMAFQPFTLRERIQQLNGIDKKIVEILSHTSTLLTTLSIQTPDNIAPQQEAFQSAMEDLLTTVRHVDVHMKRQIIGLEEAGILDLANERTEADAREGEKVSLKPNALGSVGNLDVGWLNSRGEKNERDMEAELWGKGRAVLERAANGTSGDVNMQ